MRERSWRAGAMVWAILAASCSGGPSTRSEEPSLAGAAADALPAPEAPLTVVPGLGIGALRLGMTRAEALAALPGAVRELHERALQWERGVAVTLDEDDRVALVACGWNDCAPPDLPPVRARLGGIASGSSPEAVRAELGPPEREGPAGEASWWYPSRGVVLYFGVDGVSQFMVIAPRR